jgi:hypothetical protein
MKKTRLVAVTSLSAACLLATGIPATASTDYPTPSPSHPVNVGDLIWDVYQPEIPARETGGGTPASQYVRCKTKAAVKAKRKALRKDARAAAAKGKLKRAAKLRMKARGMKRCRTIYIRGSKQGTGPVLPFVPPDKAELIGCTWRRDDPQGTLWTGTMTYRITGGQFDAWTGARGDARKLHVTPGKTVIINSIREYDPSFFGPITINGHVIPSTTDPRGEELHSLWIGLAQTGDFRRFEAGGAATLKSATRQPITCG